DPGVATQAAVADLDRLAESAYARDGVHPSGPQALARLTSAQIAAAGSLAWLLRESPHRRTERTRTIVQVLRAGAGSARVLAADALRVSSAAQLAAAQSPAKAEPAVPLAVVPDRPTVHQAQAALSAATRPESAKSDPAGPAPAAAQSGSESARMLGLAQSHLGRMDQALQLALPSVAMVHAGATQYWSLAAMQSLGIRPFSSTDDQDRDQLPDAAELWLGTHPLRPDSDADGLADGPEVAQLFAVSNPTRADSDGDGRRDGDEDPDGDLRSNRQELADRTNPLNDDEDRDGLSDSAERAAGTSPQTADSDGDGLLDGTEVDARLNPLRADTDQDGQADGREVIQQKVTAVPGGIALSVTGSGQLATLVSARPLSLGDDERALGGVGSGVDLSLPGNRVASLTQARLSLPYPKSTTRPENLAVFAFDEALSRWQPAGTSLTVDPAQRTVSVTIRHFSRYALFDRTVWQQRWASLGQDCTSGANPRPADVALVIDSSGSMVDNDPQGLRRTAATEFVQALSATDRASVVDFDDIATVREPLTSDTAALRAAIAGVDNLGGTNLSAGVSAGLGTLPAASQGRVNALILLADGDGSWDPALLDRALALKAPIFAIGLGEAVNAPRLQQIATATEGQYYPVNSATDLPRVFRSLAGCVNDPVPGAGLPKPDCAGPDGDRDGLRDCLETGGMALGDGSIARTDPADFDSDNDGLGDG
ncbi:MAG: VWA domain-containing protein, partial [Angustibacter sp.]